MDNFKTPKIINRQVLRAIYELQGRRSDTSFVFEDAIIKHVQEKMKLHKTINVDYFVPQSLINLTHLGVLVRSGSSEYALRQSLEMDEGVSAIPWKRPDFAMEIAIPKPAVNKPKSMTKKPQPVKHRIIKAKNCKTGIKSTVLASKIKCDNHSKMTTVLKQFQMAIIFIENIAKSVKNIFTGATPTDAMEFL